MHRGNELGQVDHLERHGVEAQSFDPARAVDREERADEAVSRDDLRVVEQHHPVLGLGQDRIFPHLELQLQGQLVEIREIHGDE